MKWRYYKCSLSNGYKYFKYDSNDTQSIVYGLYGSKWRELRLWNHCDLDYVKYEEVSKDEMFLELI